MKRGHATLIPHSEFSIPHLKGSGGGSCAHGGRAYEARLNLILPAVKWFAEPKRGSLHPPQRSGRRLVESMGTAPI